MTYRQRVEMKWRMSCVLLVTSLATATANVTTSAPLEAGTEAAPPVSLHSGTQWYWSVSRAEAFLQHQKLSGGTLISSAACQGDGASKASDGNLYDRFRCTLSGASYGDSMTLALTLRVTGRRTFALTLVGPLSISAQAAGRCIEILGVRVCSGPPTAALLPTTSPDSMTVANTTMPPGRTDPATAVTLAEQMLENDPTWSTATMLCGSAAKSSFNTVPNAMEETYSCKWVRQGNPSGPSTETDTVSIVFGAGGRYLFSLVSSTFQPSGSPAACQINQASNSYRISCHPAS